MIDTAQNLSQMKRVIVQLNLNFLNSPIPERRLWQRLDLCTLDHHQATLAPLTNQTREHNHE